MARIHADVDAKSLERVPLFAGLSHKEREKIARWADAVDAARGHTICSTRAGCRTSSS